MSAPLDELGPVEPRGGVARAVGWAGAVLVLVSVVLVALGLREISRGRAALEASDLAFHRGDLPTALARARDAGLHFVPGAAHVGAAEARLEAIARGAEAEGRLELARRAWDALRLVDEETDYPGRAPSEAGARARTALERLGQAPR